MSAITATPSGADEATTLLAADFRARRPTALSAVYQTYGSQLFDYAMGMLGHREAAEDAVHDALLVAMYRAGTLQRQAELPLWLYALVRNECLRQVRRGRRGSPHGDGNASDRTVRFGADPLTEQTRAWVRDAAAGLDPLQREALDLASRHGLNESEIGTVMDLPARRVAALIRAASAALDRTLDVLVTSRAGRHGCPELDQLLSGWDGHLTPAVRARISRHLDACHTCAAVTWEYAGAVELYADLDAELPPRLLERRLLATASVPTRVSSRADIAEPFERSGYPVPLDRVRRWRPLTVSVGVVIAVGLAAAGVYAATPERDDWTVADAQPRPDLIAGPIDGLVGATAPPNGEPTPSGPPFQPLHPLGAFGSAEAGPSAPAPQALPSQSPPTVAMARPAPAPQPPARVPVTQPASTGPANVDALFDDITVGCGMWWSGEVTAFVEGAQARSATLHWGVTTAVQNTVTMSGAGDGSYRVEVDELPVNVTVYWHVVVVVTDGRTVRTALATIDHDRQC